MKKHTITLIDFSYEYFNTAQKDNLNEKITFFGHKTFSTINIMFQIELYSKLIFCLGDDIVKFLDLSNEIKTGKILLIDYIQCYIGSHYNINLYRIILNVKRIEKSFEW